MGQLKKEISSMKNLDLTKERHSYAERSRRNPKYTPPACARHGSTLSPPELMKSSQLSMQASASHFPCHNEVSEGQNC
jgi:hypothetical protein